MLVTDTILLLTVLVGLLRLRRNGGGRFGLGQLLWAQVRSLLFALVGVLLLIVVYLFVRASFGSCFPSLRKFHQWYVSLVSCMFLFHSKVHFMTQVLITLNLNGISFLCSQRRILI